MLTLLSELAFLYVLTLTTTSTIAVILVDTLVKNVKQWAVLTGQKITESSNRPSFIGRIVQGFSLNLLREEKKHSHSKMKIKFTCYFDLT